MIICFPCAFSIAWSHVSWGQRKRQERSRQCHLQDFLSFLQKQAAEKLSFGNLIIDEPRETEIKGPGFLMTFHER